MKKQYPYLKLQIEKGMLLSGLQGVQGVLDKGRSAPIFSSVLLESQTTQFSLTATDLEIGIKCTYPATVQGEGAIAVSGRKFFEIVRELPEGNVDLTVEEGKFLTIISRKSYFKITGSNKEDFPVIPIVSEEKMTSIDNAMYIGMIKKTLFAIAEAEARHVLNGGLFEIERDNEQQIRLRMVGTDGNRMAICERIIEDTKRLLEKEEGSHQIILPKKTLIELRRLMDAEGEIKIGIGEKQISFMGGGVYITSRIIEGNFPNYKQVVPQKEGQEVRVNRSDFVSVVRRVSVMSREKTRVIIIEFSPEGGVVRAKDPEIGEGREEFELKYKGEPITIGLNYQYLLEALDSLTDKEVIIELQSGLNPCVIKQESDPNSLCIVMPMRVQEVE